MRLFKKIPITFEEKDYEVRVLYEDTAINVVAFLNNYPANGYRYQVQLPKKCNVQRVLEQDFVDELVEMSKNDIIEKRWEKLSKIIRVNMANV
ncbi:MAG: hypothetical protein ACXACY_26955 [Candidatus Hodarchaeales archaeon]|jgi:hypothetical protein